MKKKNKEGLTSVKEKNYELSENKKKNKKNWLVSGIVTILIVIILIDLYILVNIGLEKMILPEIDLTENKIYTLSQETETKLKNIEDEVIITFINYEDKNSIVKLAEKYVLLNNKIKIEKIDNLESRKDLMEEYSLDTTSQLITINSGENETILSDYDLYTYDYSTYEMIDTSEESITNAIVDVTTKDKPKVYFMSNHAEYEVGSHFYILMDSMKKDANEVATLDILTTGSVPEDCDTLVITTLEEDITALEKDEIIEYINKGGEILLLIGPNIIGKDLTNFQEVLNQYGITIEEGVIFEGSTSNMLHGYPDFIIEKLQNSSLTENLNMNISVCLADAASIKFNEEKQEELNVEYEELAYTSEKAFLRKNLFQSTPYRTDFDSEESKFTIAGIASKTIDENNISKLIIFGNELFVSNMRAPLDGYEEEQKPYIIELYNNEDAVLNSIAYLNEREDTITIRKSYDYVTYTATQLEHNIIMAIIFVVPVLIIIIGIIVWQVRRRKK